MSVCPWSPLKSSRHIGIPRWRSGFQKTYTGSALSSEDILSQTPPEPDSRLAYGADASHFVDVRVPAGKGPHPVVFFIHGGFWRSRYDLTYAGHLCHALKSAGIAT